MAITGSGTQADPFIVHNYDELKTAALTTGFTPIYIELANNIDCNDYSMDFEWGISTSGNLGIGIDLDLKGFTIKNLKVKANSYAFKVGGASKIHDGKILNVFLSNAYGLAGITTNTTNTLTTFENVSISMNGMGAVNSANWNNTVAYCAKFVKCAVYYEDSASAKSSLAWTRDSAKAFENCDIKVIKSGDGFSIASSAVDNCRFTGKISSSTTASNWICAAACTNSVIDVDFSECTGGGASPVINSGSNTVCNTDTFTTHTTTANIISCTSQEIIIGADLRAKGFTVANVQR